MSLPKDQCQAQIRLPGSLMATYQCGRRGTVVRNGMHYCWQHDPERIARRQRKRSLEVEIEICVSRLHSVATSVGYAYLCGDAKSLDERVGEFRKIEAEKEKLEKERKERQEFYQRVAASQESGE